MDGHPGYWRDETSGVLAPAVETYLRREELSADHVAALRAYLRQWMGGDWRGEAHVAALKGRIGGLYSRASFDRWFADALEIGIDPL